MLNAVSLPLHFPSYTKVENLDYSSVMLSCMKRRKKNREAGGHMKQTTTYSVFEAQAFAFRMTYCNPRKSCLPFPSDGEPKAEAESPRCTSQEAWIVWRAQRKKGAGNSLKKGSGDWSTEGRGGDLRTQLRDNSPTSPTRCPPARCCS